MLVLLLGIKKNKIQYRHAQTEYPKYTKCTSFNQNMNPENKKKRERERERKRYLISTRAPCVVLNKLFRA